MDFFLSKVNKSASEIETNCLFTYVVIWLQMPFEKLNYNGDFIDLIGIMHVHDQHFRHTCHITI